MVLLYVYSYMYAWIILGVEKWLLLYINYILLYVFVFMSSLFSFYQYKNQIKPKITHWTFKEAHLTARFIYRALSGGLPYIMDFLNDVTMAANWEEDPCSMYILIYTRTL